MNLIEILEEVAQNGPERALILCGVVVGILQRADRRKDACGVVYTGPSASYLSNLSFYHWLINVRPNGLILMVR